MPKSSGRSFEENIKLLILSIVFFLLMPAIAPATEVLIHTNKDTGLVTWTAIDEGFSIELIQLLPDYVRAIYGSHDFSQVEIEKIAAYCVFGTIIKNTSQHQLHYLVDDWYYLTGTKQEKRRLKTKTQWLEQWRKAGITFSWTLLPDEGTFEIGDWQQGFTTIQLPRNSSFDLIYTWTLNGHSYAGKIKNLRCAPEQLPQQ